MLTENRSPSFPGIKLVEDENDGGAILGLSKYLCPNCAAHLARSGICLNACHLGRMGMARFNAVMLREKSNDQ